MNPDTGETERFIGDPNLEEPVTGSPFNTNYVRIQGPGGIDLTTNLFSVSGKLSAVQRPTPVIVQRATYSRATGAASTSAQQDVFALAPPPPGTASYEDAAGATVTMTEANATGSWYGQSTGNPSLPASVTVNVDNSIAIPENTPNSVSAPLVDLVQIQRAEYSLNSGQLTVVASSSDETNPPALTATSTSGALIGWNTSNGSALNYQPFLTSAPLDAAVNRSFGITAGNTTNWSPFSDLTLSLTGATGISAATVEAWLNSTTDSPKSPIAKTHG